MFDLSDLRKFIEFIGPDSKKREEFENCIEKLEAELQWMENDLHMLEDELEDALDIIEEGRTSTKTKTE